MLDGINSEGLVVAILAEEESGAKVGREPGNEVGMHELMGMRYLLDNCKNVEEAKKALLSLKHYYSFIPCHYIIGDKTGPSGIFRRNDRKEIFKILGRCAFPDHQKHAIVDLFQTFLKISRLMV